MADLNKITFYSHVTLDFAQLEQVYPNNMNSNIFVNSYKPVLNNFTRSLVCFENGNDSRGITNDALGYKFSIYRGSSSNSSLIPVYSTSSGQLSIVDYNIRNQNEYKYYIFKEDDTSNVMSKAIVTNNIKPCWWDYSIIGLTPVDEDNNIYKVNIDDVWLFSSNVATDSTTQNFNKTTYQNLTQYPQISIGKLNYSSGSFSGLIGHVIKDKYEEDATLLEKWNDFCANSQMKLYKDRKGHKMIVDVSSTSSTIADETREQATTVSVGWTQIDDADNYVIIGD